MVDATAVISRSAVDRGIRIIENVLPKVFVTAIDSKKDFFWCNFRDDIVVKLACQAHGDKAIPR
jgi:hypothetical protein